MKKILSLIMASIMLLSLSVFVAAEEYISDEKIIELPDCPVGETIKIPVGAAEYIKDRSGNLIKISELMSFDTQEEADNYIAELRQQLSTTTQYNPSINFNSRATHGDALVASKVTSFFGCSINLRVAYTTSGNSNTGTITSHQAYTTFTGFTLAYEWDEKMCYSEVTSSGKDIYAEAAGELTFSIFADGLVECFTEEIHLEGYCAAVH